MGKQDKAEKSQVQQALTTAWDLWRKDPEQAIAKVTQAHSLESPQLGDFEEEHDYETIEEDRCMAADDDLEDEVGRLRRVFSQVKKKWGIMFLKVGREKQNNYTQNVMSQVCVVGSCQNKPSSVDYYIMVGEKLFLHIYIYTRIKSIKNVTRCKDSRSAKSIETR